MHNRMGVLRPMNPGMGGVPAVPEYGKQRAACLEDNDVYGQPRFPDIYCPRALPVFGQRVLSGV